jgi:hypothetical protein
LTSFREHRLDVADVVGRPEEIAATFQDPTFNAITQKSAIAAQAVPIDGSTQLNLINEFNVVTEIEQISEDTRPASELVGADSQFTDP